MEDGKAEVESSAKADGKRRPRKIVADDSHVLRKRLPAKLAKGRNHVYVNNKTDFKAFVKKCEKILDSDTKEVVVHGLGGAINKTCNLALQLQRIHHSTLELDIKTSSVDLTDDLEPTNDDADYEVNERTISAIHIRLYRTTAIGALRF